MKTIPTVLLAIMVATSTAHAESGCTSAAVDLGYLLGYKRLFLPLFNRFHTKEEKDVLIEKVDKEVQRTFARVKLACPKEEVDNLFSSDTSVKLSEEEKKILPKD